MERLRLGLVDTAALERGRNGSGVVPRQVLLALLERRGMRVTERTRPTRPER